MKEGLGCCHFFVAQQHMARQVGDAPSAWALVPLLHKNSQPLSYGLTV